MEQFRLRVVSPEQLPCFMCIVGPDGVGKTTQAKLLQGKLEKIGVKQKYVWLRHNRIISLPVLALARIAKLSRVREFEKGGKIVYHDFHKSKPISILYGSTLLIDMLFSVIMRVRIPILFGRIIICDRFIPDTLVDLVVSTRNYNLFNSIILRFFVALIPKGKILMLKAQEEDLRSRKEDVREDEELGLKISAYEIIASRLHIMAIDGHRSIQSVHNEIVKAFLPQVDCSEY